MEAFREALADYFAAFLAKGENVWVKGVGLQDFRDNIKDHVPVKGSYRMKFVFINSENEVDGEKYCESNCNTAVLTSRNQG